MASVTYKNIVTITPKDLVDYILLQHSDWDIEQIYQTLQDELMTWVEDLINYWGYEYTSIEDDLDTLENEIESYMFAVWDIK